MNGMDDITDSCVDDSYGKGSRNLSSKDTVSCINDIGKSFDLYNSIYGRCVSYAPPVQHGRFKISAHSTNDSVPSGKDGSQDAQFQINIEYIEPNEDSQSDSSNVVDASHSECGSFDSTGECDDYSSNDEDYDNGKGNSSTKNALFVKDMYAKFKKYGVGTKEISECSDYLNGNKPIDLIRNPHCRVPIIVFSLISLDKDYKLMNLVCDLTGCNSGYDEVLSEYDYTWSKSNEGVCNMLFAMLRNVVTYNRRAFPSMFMALNSTALSSSEVERAVSKVLARWEEFAEYASLDEMYYGYERSCREYEEYYREHEESCSEYEEPCGEHERSCREHEESRREYEEPCGEHERSYSEHEESRGEHERSCREYERSRREYEGSEDDGY
jgi:hypothetical protein